MKLPEMLNLMHQTQTSQRDELERVRRMLLNSREAYQSVCSHAFCENMASHGKSRDNKLPDVRYTRVGDILKIRINVQEKRGTEEELVDHTSGKTYYYNARLDQIQFEKPKRWVRS